MHTLRTTEGQEHLCGKRGQGTRNLGSRCGPSWQMGVEEPMKAEEEQIEDRRGFGQGSAGERPLDPMLSVST